MSKHDLSLKLIGGSDDIELFAAHETILRALIITKLCDLPESDRVIDSSIIKSIADSLTRDMDNLGAKIGIRPNGSQKKFLTVSGCTDRSYVALLNRVCCGSQSRIREYLNSSHDDQAVEYINYLFSPFIIDSILALKFKSDVANLSQSMNEPS
ncbi:hypothetical protein K7W42_12775 [Deinococcus sp. HMF7604]|uniref:hypothetical protein n=1 Tax=Deinococcus betulae TaxID=2873312 RepID=UPI001CCF5CC2|nr:hypothetical protein [Deinococcus betulae]MBZ9751734.1 hypothetical protein [Deinococcus betulae]